MLELFWQELYVINILTPGRSIIFLGRLILPKFFAKYKSGIV